MTDVAVNLQPRIEPEDRVRADFYALFARLLIGAPDAGLLQMMGDAPFLDADADESALALAWARLSAAARVMDADAAADEYDALFGGIGKSAVSLFGSYYVLINAPGAGGTFLVDLRAALADLGVGLRTGQNMPEDHLSAVLETMRLLIEGNSGATPRGIEEQFQFFGKFIGPWYASCCAAIRETSLANFYKSVAECIDAFLAIENVSFEIA